MARKSEPFLLEQEWEKSLVDWDESAFVEVARGTHRHVVKFLLVGERIFALKELPGNDAMREYRLLQQMAEDGLPVVQTVAVIIREDLPDILVTRYLDFSLPYRHLFRSRWGAMAAGDEITQQLLDALSLLLVRMHLAGYYWGDCSLNNALLKRDAGALAAYVVDVETGERQPSLSDGQRMADLEIAELNMAGGLMDVQAELDVDTGLDPRETADSLHDRYCHLWEELTREEIVRIDERYLIEERIRRLNELGFHVNEVEVIPMEDGEGRKLRLRTCVTERGHYSRRLVELTGIRAEENQARTLLNDIASFRSWLKTSGRGAIPTSAGSYLWLTDVFDPTVDAIPEALRGKLDPVEVFVEILAHKWLLSEAAGHDIGLPEAVSDYLATILPDAPDERVVVADPDSLDTGWIGYG